MYNYEMTEIERAEYIEQFKMKKLDEGNYNGYFLLFNNDERLEEYIRLFDQIPHHQKYPLFIKCWTHANSGFHLFNSELINDISHYQHHNSRKKMIRQLNQFVDTDGFITIYRGENRYSNPHGISWTLDLKVAQWFANRHLQEDPIVIGAKSRPEDVLAYITDRQEAEILINDNSICDLEQVFETKKWW